MNARAEIAGLLSKCIWPRLVAIQLHSTNFQSVPSERPFAYEVARYQAKTSNQVTNLAHHTVALGAAERRLLPLLDGQHDRKALLDHLVDLAVTNQIQVRDNKGVLITDAATLQTLIGPQLDAMLNKIAAAALLSA